MIRALAARMPPRMRQRARRLARPAWLGTLRRTEPLSAIWGFDRGTPVDRYYIEQFLDAHRSDIRGRALEVRDSTYTRRFGTGVRMVDVLDVNPANPRATIVADLTSADAIPSDAFDCVVLTQVLQYIFDSSAAIAHVYRILRPGGVLLATVPAASRLHRKPGLEREYWRFTVDSCRALFGEVFGGDCIEVESHGNVLSTVAFFMGLAYEELSRRELDTNDTLFPLIVSVRAVKRAAASSRAGG